MNRPTFSVIIGAYNQEKTIGMLAEALNRQTFQDFEVHLCDDGSDDDTIQVFLNTIRPSIRVRIHKQMKIGMRLSKSINNGVREARGDYCVFIMGDSFPEQDYLEVFNKFVAPHRILCGVRYQVDNGVGVDADWRIKKGYIPSENVMLPNYPYKDITGNGLVVPTEALAIYGGWNEKISEYGGDDYELVARLYYKGYVVWSIIDARLYHNWHKSKETNPENIEIIKDLLAKYDNGL